MKRRISIFALSFLLFMTSWISATAVKAETTYTWEYVGGSFCGTEEGDMRVMHQKINETHSDGEQNYADLYCALQIPPKSIPADKELALKVKLSGTVSRNDRNRGMYMSCDVIVAPSDLDMDATLNAGYSMTPDDYSALSWGNYAGGFGNKETVVRRTMSHSGYSEGDTISIYLRSLGFGQCEWKYRLKKTGSDGNGAGNNTSNGSYAIVGKCVYVIKNNKATFYCPKNVNATSITVPATIKYKGKKISVTAIDSLAFKGYKNLKSVTIGKNVKKIGAKAFYGCKKLKKITIKSTKLTKKTVGSKAFTGIYKKAVVKCPKAKKAAYKKILLKKGMKKTVKFK